MKDGENVEQLNKEKAIDLWKKRPEQPKREMGDVPSYPQCDEPLRIAGWVDKVQ